MVTERQIFVLLLRCITSSVLSQFIMLRGYAKASTASGVNGMSIMLLLRLRGVESVEYSVRLKRSTAELAAHQQLQLPTHTAEDNMIGRKDAFLGSRVSEKHLRVSDLNYCVLMFKLLTVKNRS